MEKEQIIKEIKNHKEEMAKHRDALREIYEELASDLDAFERGVEQLDCAIDNISEVI